jgi:hypothetical protein
MRPSTPLFEPPLPPPTKKGLIFNVAMLVAPLVGLFVGRRYGAGGALFGLLAGMIVAIIGLSWLFFVKGARASHCASCGRPLREGPPNPPWMGNMGVMISTSELRSGRQGPGHQCLNCARTYCSDCDFPGLTCECGATRLRLVRLIYP